MLYAGIYVTPIQTTRVVAQTLQGHIFHALWSSRKNIKQPMLKLQKQFNHRVM